MSEPDTTTGPLNLPMQPTGSGVTDLEIAREQDAIANEDDVSPSDDADDPVPTEPGRDADESAAQPS